MFAKMHRQPPLGYTEFIDFLECGSKFVLTFGNLVGMPNVEAVEADAADSSHGLVPCRGKGQRFSLGANKNKQNTHLSISQSYFHEILFETSLRFAVRFCFPLCIPA